MIAEVVGNYRLLERIGRGGMGEVYLAEHRRMPRRVAIKILLPELSADPTLLDRFFLEARSIAVLEHPGIVKVIDCDVHDGRAFIVMEHLEGEPLSARLRREGRFSSWLDAIDVGRQIAEAIASAHAKNIVHRDLKPENVFLVRDEAIRVKVLDFGVAKLVVDGATLRTREGAMLGTPTYMAPEQCRDPRSVDGRADIYSFGCLLFEMLGGRPPFPGRGFGELISLHLSAVPPSIASLNETVPGALSDLVAELLAKKPGARPQSMVEVGARLSMMKVTAAMRATEAQTLILNPEEAEEAEQADALSLPRRAARATRDDWGVGTGTLVAPADEVELPARGRRTTTLSQAVGEVGDAGTRRRKLATPRKRRGAGRLAVPGIGLIAAGAVVAIVAGAQRSPPAAGPVPPAASLGETRALSPPAAAPPAPAPTALPEIAPAIVRDEILIDVTGAPDGLAITDDGHEVSLPLRWPRGSDEHHLLFKAKGYRDRAMTVTASRNRLIDLQMQRPSASPSARPAAKTSSSYDPDGVARPAWAR